MLSLLRVSGGWSVTFSNILAAVLFSAAHAHDSIVAALSSKTSLDVDTLVQCGFTLIFGLFTGFIFIRSRSVWTCFLIHVICNVVGFPDIGLVLRLPSVMLLVLGLLAGLFSALSLYLLRTL